MGTIFQQRLFAKPTNNVISEQVDRITCSKDSNYIASLIWEWDNIEIYETCFALFLNRNNKIISYAQISIGGVSGVVIDAKIVLSHALLAGASGIILYHNHPSGNTEPSVSDRQLTQKMVKACESLDLVLHDHVIVTPFFLNYYSFADNGMV